MEIRPDRALAEELARPGSDRRLGVSLVLRPPPTLTEAILALQGQLRAMEPDQYYYPAGDLHLTLLELGSGLDAPSAAALARAAEGALPRALEGLGPLRLDGALARCDAEAGFVRLLEVPGLEALRRDLAGRLGAAGVAIRPRYLNDFAHVSICRYLAPLRGEWSAWEAAFRCLGPCAPWRVTEAWLCEGATWYGRRAGLRERGPYLLNA